MTITLSRRVGITLLLVAAALVGCLAFLLTTGVYHLILDHRQLHTDHAQHVIDHDRTEAIWQLELQRAAAAQGK